MSIPTAARRGLATAVELGLEAAGRHWQRTRRTTTFVLLGLAAQLPVLALVPPSVPPLAPHPASGWGMPITMTMIKIILAQAVALEPLGALQRLRLRAVLGEVVPAPPRAGWRRFTPRGLATAARSPDTWRQLAYHVISMPLAVVGGMLTIVLWVAGAAATTIFLWVWIFPVDGVMRGVGWSTRDAGITAIGVAMLALAPWLTGLLTRWDVAAARALLGPAPAEALRRRVEDLTASRAEVLDAADAERRRIERDLHDGAQQRLVSLAMNLGWARATMTDLPEPARALVEDAHQEAKEAIRELRALVRGLHPPILDDRGLDAALSGLAARAPLPVRLRVGTTARASRTVEAVAYFLVSEALTNVTTHAQASEADVVVERVAGSDGDRLLVTVSDDGIGGALPAAGGGLAGLARRVASVDGTLRIDSPPGGPTRISGDLPCER
jgi:signal transduction histidine kinase